MVDATYFKARENHKIVSKAFLVAIAIKAEIFPKVREIAASQQALLEAAWAIYTQFRT